MKKLNEILMIFIFMLTAVLAAAVGLKAYDIYDTNKRLAREQEELELAEVMARNEEAQSRVSQMQAEILELAEDKEELERFIVRIQSGEQSFSGEETVSSNAAVSGNASVSYNGVSGNGTGLFGSDVSGNGAGASGSDVSGNGTGAFDSDVSGNGTGAFTSDVSGNGTGLFGIGASGNGTGGFHGDISGNGTVSGNVDAFGNIIPGIRDTVSGNGEVNYYDGSMTNSSIFDEWRIIYEQEEMSLEARRLFRTSLEETLEVNQADHAPPLREGMQR